MISLYWQNLQPLYADFDPYLQSAAIRSLEVAPPTTTLWECPRRRLLLSRFGVFDAVGRTWKDKLRFQMRSASSQMCRHLYMSKQRLGLG
ncbi:hypothetical protein I7I50_03886 [Histoplasma capsulatum G186AR]|uniref:Uncharacterized protein n=1 Tax=Ajellomyces capsulatus TaxID=5037 RepID=A0A8H7YLU8_AJECA|nr:hypothetical protein I7I52_04794 [Histoplasma capsulatum]QSS74921.1 hypothetical protein I7I50_03886 [Histoplasma capsulatum G186AR]